MATPWGWDSNAQADRALLANIETAMELAGSNRRRRTAPHGKDFAGTFNE